MPIADPRARLVLRTLDCGFQTGRGIALMHGSSACPAEAAVLGRPHRHILVQHSGHLPRSVRDLGRAAACDATSGVIGRHRGVTPDYRGDLDRAFAQRGAANRTSEPDRITITRADDLTAYFRGVVVRTVDEDLVTSKHPARSIGRQRVREARL